MDLFVTQISLDKLLLGVSARAVMQLNRSGQISTSALQQNIVYDSNIHQVLYRMPLINVETFDLF